MSDTVDQRFAPPQAHVADIEPAEAVLAGRGTRLLATMIDFLILFGVIIPLAFVPGITNLLLKPAGATASNIGQTLIGLSVFLVLNGWPLLTRGQTLGKMLFKLRIVRTDGSRPEAWRLLGLRYGIGYLFNLNIYASLIYSLIDSLLIFRTSRKCLHDTIADTKVIKL